MAGVSREQIHRLLEKVSKEVPRRIMPVVKDSAVVDGTRKWMEMIRQLDFCPFLDKYASSSNSEIVVQRSLSENDLLMNAMHVLDNPQLNIATVVLPTLPMPNPQEVADLSEYIPMAETIGETNHLIPSLAMGAPLIKTIELLENHGIIEPTFAVEEEKKSSSSPLLFPPVVFNPFFLGTSNWSPWPTIQFIKKSVMDQAKAEYKEQHGGKSASTDIPQKNHKRLDDLLGDVAERRALLLQHAECYKGNDLESYKEFMMLL
mmetsp:Transcript_2472/g.6876  ORF Transcript_2472/g.6876 Transcript_2472/m.6876 type:complete len:261 (+) Transcript_2472:242-1024(+)|eukprot:CAMPEP_0168738388 /NCGR_PEP_ID=MMETSP0724-20121128/10904_1 /TAXON_ID=265536 /ORGANISM="Amphiprora sp., Strain CCMP467" /LENGTH=260 /DNA_ID=CAMNT_0008785723 /DNA_START=177 /DNA_END=959 /DNA_ORIENTATION=-